MRKQLRNVYLKAGVTLALLLLALPGILRASTVLQVSFEEIVRSSEYIFEGRVVERAAQIEGQGRIYTYVKFEVLDLLKGKPAGQTIVLRYLGGTVGETTLDVSDVVPPASGERGVYFVESLSRPLVHPLFGWDQGHFLIARGSDQSDHVMTRNRHAVMGFQPTIVKSNDVSTGIAAGLVVADSTRVPDAVTLTDFKRKIRELLGQ